ncbi:MAG: hypothetical protein OXN17_17740 [Candidatus Poribacteria bacterium]|nr:hypothetical protein [Candidatus Poribacteria bacterium]
MNLNSSRIFPERLFSDREAGFSGSEVSVVSYMDYATNGPDKPTLILDIRRVL